MKMVEAIIETNGEVHLVEPTQVLTPRRPQENHAMSEPTKSERLGLVEPAVKAGTAPQPGVGAFNELSTLRAELKKLGAPEGYSLRAMNCPHHTCFFVPSFLCC